MTEHELFQAVLDLPDAASRAEYLDRVCAGDPDRRGRIEALLQSHETADSFLGTPAAEPPDYGSAETTDFSIGPAPESRRRNDSPPRLDDDDELRAFLSPSTRPDSFGRLGHYEVLQVLGRGGFGVVFRAFDDVLQRVVAVKMMAPKMAATSPARKRFLREARASAAIRHENVVQVYEVAEQPLPYLVMEFIPGETLQERIDRHGPLDVKETLQIGRQIAEGLAAAHLCDLIHRDIKPGNVLLEGGALRVKITDFGLARAADDASMTQSGVIAGTPLYMAPEQALGESLTERADLFSFGSVLYQMVTGRPPFRANSTLAVMKRVAEDTPRPIREITPEAPQWLCDIIAKLHAKKPEDRFRSAREVADVLADCEAQLKANAKLKDFSRIPRGAQPVAARKPGRRTWVAAAAALLIPVIALALTEGTGVTHLVRGRPAVPVPHAVDASSIPLHPAAADGWVQLFNGKDLAGWKPDPLAPGDWGVEDGVLVGRGDISFLLRESKVYDNFHLRVEAKINATGDSGIVFRIPSSDVRNSRGYEAQIAVRSNYPIHTGSLFLSNVDGPPLILARARLMPHRPDEWFVLEVIADGNHLQTRVNGLIVADCHDDQQTLVRGHIALGNWGKNITFAQFRKIEIKELPASPSDLAPGAGSFALAFDGDKSVVSIPSLKIIEDHALTVEAWMVLEQPADQPKSCDLLGNPALRGGFALYVPLPLHGGDGKKLAFMVRQTAPAKPALAWEKQPVPRNQLIHVAGVYDGSTEIRFYVDGQLQSRTPAQDVKPSPSAFLLGNNRAGDGGFLGRMHEVRVSKIARYDKDFTPVKRFEPDPDTLALYHFNEGSGDMLKDSSGNGHHGQIVGATWVKADGPPVGSLPSAKVAPFKEADVQRTAAPPTEEQVEEVRKELSK